MVPRTNPANRELSVVGEDQHGDRCQDHHQQVTLPDWSQKRQRGELHVVEALVVLESPALGVG